MNPARLTPTVVVAAAAVVLLGNLGGPALWDEDEPKNAACSAEMLDRGDWIVPTYNGRLRVEKPALVNWVHMAGFAVAGRTEAGARIGSATLTIGSALLTWRVATTLLGGTAGLWGGLAMATCIATAVSGRSATPDAPLTFCTTLALWCFVAARRGRAPGEPGDARWSAACGAALGAAVLAKGPVGIVLPMAAFIAYSFWESGTDGGPLLSARRAWAGLQACRPAILGACAIAVALPWYAAVTIRTDGAWLDRFLLVHNVGRFAAPMEGHDGSSLLYYPAVLAVGFFPWSIVLAAALLHAAALSRAGAAEVEPRRRSGVRLMACWLACWVVAFSAAGTKLPGYVWPAYPALAALIGDFLASWIRGECRCTSVCRDPRAAMERVMALAWSILFLAGAAMTVGLTLTAPSIPRLGTLAPLGLVPMAGAVAAWHFQTRSHRGAAIGILAATALLLVAVLASAGAGAVGGAHAARSLVASLGERPARGAWAGFGSVPPSVVFYAGDTIPSLESTEAVSAHLASRPDAHLLVDARFEMNLPSRMPEGFGVLARRQPLFGPGLLVIGPLSSTAPTDRPETPLAWNAPTTPR